MKTLWRLFFSNLSIKLVSVFLAALVYAHVATNREQDLTYKVPLRVKNLADTLSIMSPVPAAAQVTFRGRGRDIYLALLRGARMELDLGTAGPGWRRHLASGRDVSIPAGLEVLVTDVASPETLEVQLDRHAERRVPVRVMAATGVVPGGRALPESVSVDGPAALVNHTEWIQTEIAPAGATGELMLNLKPASTYLHVTPRQVRARIAK